MQCSKIRTMEKILICLFVLCIIKNGFCATVTPVNQDDRGDNGNPENHNEQAKNDAKLLHEAIIGLGTDEKTISEIITGRTNSQRQIIRKEYRNLFDSDLIEDLKEDLSGHYENLIVALMLEPHVFVAKQCNKYLATISAVLTFVQNPLDDMLCTKTGEELSLINEAYKKLYSNSIADELDEFDNDKHMQFLKKIVTEGRRTDNIIDTESGATQVDLLPTEPGNCTSDEYDPLLDFLATENFEQIRYVIKAYNVNYTMAVEEYLRDWCDDVYLSESYITVVRYARNPVKYYAEELHDSMIGLGTKDDKLIRIIVGRNEIDLYDIKKEYENLYNTKLISAIEADTSGHYRNTLVTLVEKAQQEPKRASDVAKIPR